MTWVKNQFIPVWNISLPVSKYPEINRFYTPPRLLFFLHVSVLTSKPLPVASRNGSQGMPGHPPKIWFCWTTLQSPFDHFRTCIWNVFYDIYVNCCRRRRQWILTGLSNTFGKVLMLQIIIDWLRFLATAVFISVTVTIMLNADINVSLDFTVLWLLSL